MQTATVHELAVAASVNLMNQDYEMVLIALEEIADRT